jgi:hypothetical protein
LVGEGFEKGDLSFGEQLRVDAAENDRTNRGAFSHQGNGKKSSEAHAARVLAALWEFVHLALHVSDVEGPSVQHRSTSDSSADKRKGCFPDGASGNRSVMGYKEEPVAFPAPDVSVGRFTQASRALRYGIEHGPDISRRAGDDAEDFARGGLLLQSFGEVAIARLLLVDKPGVFYRNDSLVGKGFEQLDLLF